jgi:hypothetical protein
VCGEHPVSNALDIVSGEGLSPAGSTNIDSIGLSEEAIIQPTDELSEQHEQVLQPEPIIAAGEGCLNNTP